MQTYRLTPSGYELFLDGAPWVTCPYDPAAGGKTPFADDAAKLAHIAENFPEATPMT